MVTIGKKNQEDPFRGKKNACQLDQDDKKEGRGAYPTASYNPYPPAEVDSPPTPPPSRLTGDRNCSDFARVTSIQVNVESANKNVSNYCCDGYDFFSGNCLDGLTKGWLARWLLDVE